MTYFFAFLIYALLSSSLVFAGWEEQPTTVPNDAGIKPSGISPSAFAANWLAFSGGVYDDVNHNLIVLGGGHADGNDNSVYAFNVDTLTWANLKPWTSGPVGWATNSCTIIEDPIGHPTSRHTFQNLVYIPPENGRSDPQMLLYGGSIACASGGFGQDTWIFNLTTNTWSKLFETHAFDPGPWGATLTYDTTNNAVWSFTNDNGSLRLHKFDLSTNAWVSVSAWPSTTKATLFGTANSWRYSATFLPTTAKRYPGQMLLVGGGETNDTNSNPKAVIVDVNNPTTQPQTIATESSCTEAFRAKAPGVAYDITTDKVVIYKGAVPTIDTDTTDEVWTFDLLTLHCKKIDDTGGPAFHSQLAGVFGRFAYIPHLDKFVTSPDKDQNVYLYTNPDTTQVYIPDNTWHRNDLPINQPSIAPVGTGTTQPSYTMKHLRMLRWPNDGKFYLFGGDHLTATFTIAGGSGVSAAYTYDVKTDTWALIHDVCPTETNQVRLPGMDQYPVAFRNADGKFWFFPGFQWTHPNHPGWEVNDCPDGTCIEPLENNSGICSIQPDPYLWQNPVVPTVVTPLIDWGSNYSSISPFIWNAGLGAFNPLTGLYEDQNLTRTGPWATPPNVQTWGSVLHAGYDLATDTFWMGCGDNSACRYDASTDTWEKFKDNSLSPPFRPQPISPIMDDSRRRVVWLDLQSGTPDVAQMKYIDIDTIDAEAGGTPLVCTGCWNALATPPLPQENDTNGASYNADAFFHYDVGNDKYIFVESMTRTFAESKLHVYDPVLDSWEVDKAIVKDGTATTGTSPDPESIVRGNIMAFDPAQNILIVFGGAFPEPDGANPNVWWYRFGQSIPAEESGVPPEVLNPNPLDPLRPF